MKSRDYECVADAVSVGKSLAAGPMCNVFRRPKQHLGNYLNTTRANNTQQDAMKQFQVSYVLGAFAALTLLPALSSGKSPT